MTLPFPMGDLTYEMILTGDSPDTMIGGYAKSDRGPSRWISYVSGGDVYAVATAAALNGGKVVEAPVDLPSVGRRAGIADPQGAELHLLERATGDRPDAQAAPGQFFWNELHTSDPDATLARAQKLGAKIPMSPEDIPGAGRFGVLEDPTGAILAVMKPKPSDKPR